MLGCFDRILLIGMFGEKGLQGKYLVFGLLSVKISLNSYPIALFTKGNVFFALEHHCCFLSCLPGSSWNI